MLIARSQIDISGVSIPDTLNDDYFRRSKAKKVRHGEGEIFEQKKAAYVVSEQRKKDQVGEKEDFNEGLY